MSTYTDACDNNSAYRSSYSTKKKAFLIKANELAQLQAAHEGGLDGVRIYLGLDGDGDFVGHFVGVVKDTSDNYNDVNCETAIIKAKPCPTFCGSGNGLNS